MKGFLKSSSWKFLLLELVVVFIGVYGAFYLTTLREEQIDRHNRVNYYKTFMLNLEDLRSHAIRVKAEVDSTISTLQKDSEAEITVNRNINFTKNMLIVRSGFESENFTTIGQEYLASLDRGSDLISMIQLRAGTIESETRTFLIYGKDASEKEFRTWYVGELSLLSRLLGALQNTISNGAVPETREMIKRLEANE